MSTEEHHCTNLSGIIHAHYFPRLITRRKRVVTYMYALTFPRID